VIQVLIYYGAAVAAYVTALGGLVAASLWRPELAVAVSAAMLLLWGWLRANRRERLREGRLEFEEVETPVVSALQVNPD
jgi:positive regulator of sigma E activity